MRWLRRPPAGNEIDEELRFHLEEKERRLIADGFSPSEARGEARKSFGSQAAVREYTRDAWTFRWADDLWRDLRFAARGLRRSPGFTAVAVLTLALGIGANATIFSFVNALLLRDLPVENPGELVWFGTETEGSTWDYLRTSYRQLELLQQDSDGFLGLAAVGTEFGGLTVGEFSRPISIQLVSADYFRVLGVRAALGRLLDDEESQPNATPSVILSHEVWRNFFNADPTALGRTAVVNGQPFVVVGVAPRGFPGTDAVRRGDVWMPIAKAPLVQRKFSDGSSDWRTDDWLTVMGRLENQGSLARASTAAEVGLRRLLAEQLDAADDPRLKQWLESRSEGQRAKLEPMSAIAAYARDDYAQRLLPLSVAVGMVLLLCCVNVANLMIGRGARRRVEFAVRLATGASRERVIRQTLTEGAMLAAIASALGIGLAWLAITSLQTQMAQFGVVNAEPDAAVLAFTVGVATLSLVGFALLPSFSLTRISLSESLRATTNTTTGCGLRARGWLVAAQFALCLPLLATSLLAIQTVQNLFAQDVGFGRAGRVQATLRISQTGLEPQQQMALYGGLLDGLRQQPGVARAALAEMGALADSMGMSTTEVIDHDGKARGGSSAWARVSDGYFETLGIPVLAGRTFEMTDDTGGTRVAIINRAFAMQFLQGEAPLGTRVGGAEVIGVVADSKYYFLRRDPEPVVYYSLRQPDDRVGPPQTVYAYAETPRSTGGFAQGLRELIGALNRNLVLDRVRTIDQQIESKMQEERMASTVLTAFGISALLISAIGLYGVMSFDVTRRTQEVGLRKALGAQAADIFRLIFRRAAPWVIGGCLVGLAGAAAMTRLLEAKLFGVAALDPLTFASAAAFLLLCAAAANYIPARRAAAVEPMTALRHD